MLQVLQLGGELTKPLSNEEKGLIYELHNNGISDKEIADQVCKKFNRETLDRTTIYRLRQVFVPNKWLPKLPSQQRFWERCNLGDHTWMERVVVPECSTENMISSDEPPKEGLLTWEYGKWTSRMTCCFCGFTTEPRDQWGIVWVSAEED